MIIYVLVAGYEDTFVEAFLTRNEAENYASTLGYDMWEIKQVEL